LGSCLFLWGGGLRGETEAPRFRVPGFGFRVSGFGFKVPGSGFRVQGFWGCRASGRDPGSEVADALLREARHFLKILSIFGDTWLQNGSKNDLTAPRTTLG